MATPDEALVLEILGVDGVIYQMEEITSIRLRLEDGGLIGIRPGHAPLIGMAAEGAVQYRVNEKTEIVNIQPGILYVNRNHVRILTTGSKDVGNK